MGRCTQPREGVMDDWRHSNRCEELYYSCTTTNGETMTQDPFFDCSMRPPEGFWLGCGGSVMSGVRASGSLVSCLSAERNEDLVTGPCIVASVDCRAAAAWYPSVDRESSLTPA